MPTASEPDPDGPLQAVLAQADAVHGMLRLAQGLVQARRAVDLAGLDGHVGLLCARALELPARDATKVRARLLALRHDLDRLQAAFGAA